MPFIYFPGSASEDTLAWKLAGFFILLTLILLVSYFIWKTRKNNPQKTELKLLNAIKKMRMDQYQLRDKIIEILKKEKVPYQEDPNFETSLSIYIGEKNQLVSLKYIYTKCKDNEVKDNFIKFLNTNNQFR